MTATGIDQVVGRRLLGPGGPSVSVIAYGAMRLPAEVDGCSPADHLCRLHDHGIDTHHSSHEYDSHGTYLEALAAARRTGRSFHHIVKLSEPGFDHHRFDGTRLTALLDGQLRALGTDRIDSLQWLFRTPDAQDSDGRIAALTEQRDEIRTWIEATIDTGKVADVSVFPYSVAFATAAIDLGLSTTLCTYLNLVELDFVPLLDRVDAFIAIRPLAGGLLLGPDEELGPVARRHLGPLATPRERAAAAVRFTLLHPKVSTTVISMNSAAHLAAALAATSGAGASSTAADGDRDSGPVVAPDPDLDLFDEIVA